MCQDMACNGMLQTAKTIGRVGQFTIQGIDGNSVVMGGTGRRRRPAVSAAAERIFTLPCTMEPRYRFMRRQMGRKRPGSRRDIKYHPMQKGHGAGRIGVKHDDEQASGSPGRPAPRERRRNIRAIRCEFFGQTPAILKCGAMKGKVLMMTDRLRGAARSCDRHHSNRNKSQDEQPPTHAIAHIHQINSQLSCRREV